jgi:hypothetical protein
MGVRGPSVGGRRSIVCGRGTTGLRACRTRGCGCGLVACSRDGQNSIRGYACAVRLGWHAAEFVRGGCEGVSHDVWGDGSCVDGGPDRKALLAELVPRLPGGADTKAALGEGRCAMGEGLRERKSAAVAWCAAGDSGAGETLHAGDRDERESCTGEAATTGAGVGEIFFGVRVQRRRPAQEAASGAATVGVEAIARAAGGLRLRGGYGGGYGDVGAGGREGDWGARAVSYGGEDSGYEAGGFDDRDRGVAGILDTRATAEHFTEKTEKGGGHGEAEDTQVNGGLCGR